MHRRTASVLVTTLVATALGCATIMNRGGKQWVTITTTPTGATATIDGFTTVETPTQLKLKRNKDHIIVFEKKGYEQKQVLIEHDVSNWVWGNILLGGLIGLAIDFGSGGAYKLEPESVNATLKPVVEESE